MTFYATLEECQAAIDASRCPCGGSMRSGGMHLITWHEEHGWDMVPDS